jgi:hypothetical protein
MTDNKSTAIQFGQSLDRDDFKLTRTFLAPDCKYVIGGEVLTGPGKICGSYQENMLEGRKKLDELVWGQSRVEPVNENEFYVHFTDFLTHKGKKFTFRCRQKLSFNSAGKIAIIEHIHDKNEQNRLEEFYRKVGLKS